MRLVLLGLVALAAQCGPTSAAAASFDCAKAGNRLERLICGSPPVSEADGALGRAYVSAMSSTVSPEELRSGQRVWQREVRDRCSDEACLMDAYRHRIEVLASTAGTKGLAPKAVERSIASTEGTIEPPKILSASEDDIQLEVTGSGPTAEAARTDGIRQSLQRTVPQIVAAERVIQNDDVVMDHIMSSMNGHVQSVDVLSTKRSGSNYEVRMRVRISRRDIVNFVSFRAQPGTSFSGAGLMSESLREAEARKFRDAFLERFLRGYPATAIHAKVTSLKPDPSNPSLVEAQIEYRLDPAFVKTLRDAAKEIQCVGAKESCSQYELCTQIDGKEIVCTSLGAGAYGQSGPKGQFGYYRSLVDTFGEPGQERSRGRLDFAMRFLDANGTRIGGQGCFDALTSSVSSDFGGRPIGNKPQPPEDPGRIAGMRTKGEWDRQTYFFSDKPLVYKDRLSVVKLGAFVDLARAQSIMLAAVIVGDQRGKDEIVLDVLRQPRPRRSDFEPVRPSEKGCLWPG